MHYSILQYSKFRLHLVSWLIKLSAHEGYQNFYLSLYIMCYMCLMLYMSVYLDADR